MQTTRDDEMVVHGQDQGLDSRGQEYIGSIKCKSSQIEVKVKILNSQIEVEAASVKIKDSQGRGYHVGNN
jgi:hypothetical protein